MNLDYEKKIVIPRRKQITFKFRTVSFMKQNLCQLLPQKPLPDFSET